MPILTADMSITCHDALIAESRVLIRKTELMNKIEFKFGKIYFKKIHIFSDHFKCHAREFGMMQTQFKPRIKTCAYLTNLRKKCPKEIIIRHVGAHL